MNFPRPLQTAAWVLLGAGLCAWSGCNLAPRSSRPAVATPAQFGETLPAPAPDGTAWVVAQPSDDAIRGRWWELYGDPRLNALASQLDGSNQDIAAAEAGFRGARAAAVAARAALFPFVGASASITRARASQTTRGGGAASSAAVVETYSLPVAASYEADIWGRVRNAAAAGADSAQAGAADLAALRLSMEAELAQDYFQLGAIDARRQILNDTVSSYRQSLGDTNALFRAGIDSEEDVARAQTQLNTTVAEATDLAVARAETEHAIAVLLGKPPAGFSLPAAPFDPRPPRVPLGLPSRLLERRPDIAAAERRVAAANARIGEARAAYFPALSLGASAGWESGELSRWFAWPSRFWSLGPQLAGTLLDGGARRAQTDQAWAEFDQAAATYRQTVLSAFQAVEDNLAALRILQEEAEEQRAAVASSQRLLDLANARFRSGIDSYLNVITAQTSLLSGREAAVQILLRQITASVSLVKALGGGWEVSQLPRLAGG